MRPARARRPWRPAGALALLLVLGGAPAADASVRAAGSDQRLVEVSPGNGESVAATPEQVVLTFAEPLDDATVAVTVRTPSGPSTAEPQVEDRDVTVPLTDAGPGSYEVAYTVTPGRSAGTTGFTVRAQGEAAPREQAASPWWTVGGVAILAGLVLVVARTVGRWRRQ